MFAAFVHNVLCAKESDRCGRKASWVRNRLQSGTTVNHTIINECVCLFVFITENSSKLQN